MTGNSFVKEIMGGAEWVVREILGKRRTQHDTVNLKMQGVGSAAFGS